MQKTTSAEWGTYNPTYDLIVSLYAQNRVLRGSCTEEPFGIAFVVSPTLALRLEPPYEPPRLPEP